MSEIEKSPNESLTQENQSIKNIKLNQQSSIHNSDENKNKTFISNTPKNYQINSQTSFAQENKVRVIQS